MIAKGVDAKIAAFDSATVPIKRRSKIRCKVRKAFAMCWSAGDLCRQRQCARRGSQSRQGRNEQYCARPKL